MLSNNGRMNSRWVLCLGILLAMLPATAMPQNYPNKPIRIIVPLPPGGSNDLVARVFSERLPAALGQPVIVENRAGGSGNPATEFVARSAPDGYTLIMSNTSHVVNAGFFAKLPYDPASLQPLSLAEFPFDTQNATITLESTL